MRIAVVGAGAIGGYLGARLALAGEDVTCIARGPNLAAMRERGLKLIEEDGSERVARVRATEVFDAMVARAARTSPSTAAAEG